MKKRPREPKPLPAVLASATGPALIKHLASCNTSVRSHSLRLIHSWLASESRELSESDIKKLWKGLFYCLWHADKTPNQVALIDRFTSLFLSLQGSIPLEFFRGFLVTLRREWQGIDRLRLDKFYLLIRRFVRSLFELVRLSNWDVGVLGEYFGVLESDGLLAEDKLQGNGVNYHLVSVVLEELKEVGFPVRIEVVDVILRPFFSVLMRCNDMILLGKVKSCLFDELLKMGKELLEKKKMGVDCVENDGDVLLGVIALKMGMSGRFYGVGSSVDCVQGNRKLVLGLHEEFLKLEKELGLSGVEISIPEYCHADGDEVPQLIPIEFEASKGGSELRDSGDAEATCNDVQPGNRISKKAKKGIDEDDKKKKKRKKSKKRSENGVSEINSAVDEDGDCVRFNNAENGENGCGVYGTAISLNETVKMDLQKQLEKAAAQMASETNQESDSSDTALVPATDSKRKRANNADTQNSRDEDAIANSGVEMDAKSEGKSAKKVRFSMKNNLVWKPQNPLPPESLRLPPSVTPRGSALKKGVAPGPIVEMRAVMKKGKKKKKVQNRLLKTTAVKQLRKKTQKQSV